eukprot:scaffold291264_cov39-Prasinocladus_malaysianus.AAC.1
MRIVLSAATGMGAVMPKTTASLELCSARLVAVAVKESNPRALTSAVKVYLPSKSMSTTPFWGKHAGSKVDGLPRASTTTGGSNGGSTSITFDAVPTIPSTASAAIWMVMEPGWEDDDTLTARSQAWRGADHGDTRGVVSCNDLHADALQEGFGLLDNNAGTTKVDAVGVCEVERKVEGLGPCGSLALVVARAERQRRRVGDRRDQY